MKAIKENLHEMLERYEKKAEQKSLGLSDIPYIQQITKLLCEIEKYDGASPQSIQEMKRADAEASL